MNLLMILLSTIFLTSGCVSKKVTCKQIKKAHIKSLPLCNVRYFQDNDSWGCNCRCFNLTDYETVNDLECGEDFMSGLNPLERCEDIAGFHVEDWAVEIRPKIKKLKNLYNNLCD